MEPKYVYSESTVQPSPIEVGLTSVFLRKDIAEDTRTDAEGNKVTYYTFQEANMTLEEFNTYANTIASVNAVKDVNNAANILSILVGQENGDMNQITIMEALADLYEAIAMIMPVE